MTTNQPGPAHIDHIGILVTDLDAAAAKYEILLGTPPVIKELAEHGLRVAEFTAANITIELLAYSGSGDGFARQVMGEAPGLNHISTRVDDLDASAAALTAAGYRMMDGFPTRGAHGRVAFFERDADTHLLFEICQPS